MAHRFLPIRLVHQEQSQAEMGVGVIWIATQNLLEDFPDSTQLPSIVSPSDEQGDAEIDSRRQRVGVQKHSFLEGWDRVKRTELFYKDDPAIVRSNGRGSICGWVGPPKRPRPAC
jgi:hypothetical protein